MRYTVDCQSPQTHILQISLHIDSIDAPSVDLQLPAWRPGRYELANYARNMLTVTAHGADNQPLYVEKITRERWRLHLNGQTGATVHYGYYARQLDAGGSCLDENLVYINFINCLFYVDGRMDEPCEVHLQLPASYQIACGAPAKNHCIITTKNYHQLADSPMMASATLQHHTYNVAQTQFHIWLSGDDTELNWQRLLTDFQQFTETQIRMMGGFPVDEYHFLLHLLPQQFYHGVEHENSTVMVLGPAGQVSGDLYNELVGLASHELFHAWNVCQIRPAELMPYDFTRENYFPTGYIAEGVTTYYGDLLLVRAGFFDFETYCFELGRTLNRHFMNSNTAHLSLVQSSFDLWVDGYTAGVPNRKVSIYHKGALAALILDLEIRQLTHDEQSLDDVMRLMWQRFGKTGIGYAHQDYAQIVEETVGAPMAEYFEICISGTAPLQNRLAKVLQHVGLELQMQPIDSKPGCLEVKIVAGEENESRRKWLEIKLIRHLKG